MSDSAERDTPPFLGSEPPPWAARGLSTLLLTLFLSGVIAAVTVKVPETVRGPFMLVPVRGTDPLRASREGTVSDVRVVEGESVVRGNVLFVIRSAPVRDREAELTSIQSQLLSAETALANARSQYTSSRQSDEADVRRVETHLEYLGKLLPIKREQATLAEEEAARRREGVARHVVSVADLNVAQQDAQRLSADVASTESEEAETRSSLVKMRADMESHRLQYEETLRQLTVARDQARIRGTAIAADSSDWSNGMLTVRAPCDGSVLRVRVTAPGAIVQAGDALSEIACANARLQAEMQVPPDGLALLRPGQGVKLLYDAFPYQRFGVRYGVVRWVGPAGVQRDSLALPFHAIIDVDTSRIAVAGGARTLVAGMGGQADVVVSRRSLVSYVFEPLRQLRESFADTPSRGAP